MTILSTKWLKPHLWSPLNQRRLSNFRNNKRGYYSLIFFSLLFLCSLFAELIANDKPIAVYYDQAVYIPVFNVYPETTFGLIFENQPD